MSSDSPLCESVYSAGENVLPLMENKMTVLKT